MNNYWLEVVGTLEGPKLIRLWCNKKLLHVVAFTPAALSSLAESWVGQRVEDGQ